MLIQRLVAALHADCRHSMPSGLALQLIGVLQVCCANVVAVMFDFRSDRRWVVTGRSRSVLKADGKARARRSTGGVIVSASGLPMTQNYMLPGFAVAYVAKCVCAEPYGLQ